MNVLVPVSASRTTAATVEYAVDQLDPSGGTIHLVAIETPGQNGRRPGRVADRASTVATARGGDSVAVVSASLGRDTSLPPPHDHAAAIASYAAAHDVDRIILDPNYSVDATDPTLQPLCHALDRVGLECQYATVPTRMLPSTAESVRFGFVTILAFAFYLAVVPSLTPFALLAGVVGAIIAGVLFRNVTFENTPVLRRVPGVLVRGVVFVPYLLGKILVANVQISYLVLHPSLPIDPHLDRVRTHLRGGLALTAMANSLTLTPGTLTVDARRDELFVHSITEASRLEVLAGERRRAIQFVYYGLSGVTPREEVDIDRTETELSPTDSDELRERDSDE